MSDGGGSTALVLLLGLGAVASVSSIALAWYLYTSGVLFANGLTNGGTSAVMKPAVDPTAATTTTTTAPAASAGGKSKKKSSTKCQRGRGGVARFYSDKDYKGTATSARCDRTAFQLGHDGLSSLKLDRGLVVFLSTNTSPAASDAPTTRALVKGPVNISLLRDGWNDAVQTAIVCAGSTPGKLKCADNASNSLVNSVASFQAWS